MNEVRFRVTNVLARPGVHGLKIPRSRGGSWANSNTVNKRESNRKVNAAPRRVVATAETRRRGYAKMQVHAVPDAERAYDSTGRKLPWAFEYAE